MRDEILESIDPIQQFGTLSRFGESELNLEFTITPTGKYFGHCC